MSRMPLEELKIIIANNAACKVRNMVCAMSLYFSFSLKHSQHLLQANSIMRNWQKNTNTQTKKEPNTPPLLASILSFVRPFMKNWVSLISDARFFFIFGASHSSLKEIIGLVQNLSQTSYLSSKLLRVPLDY